MKNENSTKEQILIYLKENTQQFNPMNLSRFTTNKIAENLYISRSVTSQYLNELAEDKKLLKVKSRPVYFLELKSLEKKYGISLENQDFLSIDELLKYIREYGISSSFADDLIGNQGSLRRVLKHASEVFDYPPNGLPLVIYGSRGTGRHKFANTLIQHSRTINGIVGKDTKVLTYKLSKQDEENVIEIKKMIESVNEKTVVMIDNFECIKEKTSNYFSQFYELSSDKINFIFISLENPSKYLDTSLKRYLPVYIKLKNFIDRPKEEREALVVSLFSKQQKILKVKIRVSSNVLRILSNYNFEENIRSLENIIKLTCSSGKIVEECLVIHTYNLPSSILESISLSKEDVNYIECDQFIPGKEIDVYISLFEEILNSIVNNEIESDFKNILQQLEDLLLQNENNEDKILKGIEVTITNIVTTVIQKLYINIPGNFIFIFSKLMFLHEEYGPRLDVWEEENLSLLDKSLDYLKKEYVNESFITDEIKQSVSKNLEKSVPKILQVLIHLALYRYNIELYRRNVYGVIICHGHSTASSIASAVNTLIGSYVFDSIDMPVTTTLSEIKLILIERLQRINRYADAVILVDMGSLEEMIPEIAENTNRNLGMVNNVSTKMALTLGYEIARGKGIDELFESIETDCKVEHRVIYQEKKSVIYFTSDAGVQISKRMIELFRDSLPIQIPVMFKPMIDNQVEENTKENILFITGTDEPLTSKYDFLPLENLITTTNLDLVSNKLLPFLGEDLLRIFINNLRKNFTLLNVVNHLTILNPKPLLDDITVAVEILLQKQGVVLDGRRLVSMYIHICVQVERLVIKSELIKDDSATADFVNTHTQFIKNVRDSFRQISKHYNIEFPDSEMKYLYSFIEGATKIGE